MSEFDLERLSLYSTVRIIRRKGHECVDLSDTPCRKCKNYKSPICQNCIHWLRECRFEPKED